MTFTLEVKNSGTAVVHGVITKITFHSASVPAACLDVRARSRRPMPASTYPSTLVVNATSTCDHFYNSPITMIAEAQPVPGETDKNNNYAHFLVEFTKG